jgi:membrane associated rhomboid family serine protease
VLFPYKDDNPSVLYPFTTYTIIGLNVSVFLLQFYIAGNNQDLARSIIFKFGLVPNRFNIIDVITSMFLHGGIYHIVGNMWFLYIFGDNIESILGHIRFIYFYIFCGAGAAFLQFIVEPTSSIPMVGASGAISGVLGAYMIKFPKAKVHVIAVVIFFITTFVVPAQVVLGVWFLMQLSGGLGSLGIDTTGGIAWFAHIGGFICGVGSIKFFQTFKIKNYE